MKKYIITLLILMTSITATQASTCIKDLNGDGIIEANTEKWNCLVTEPPICPQEMMNCTTAAITLSGTINSAPTNVQDKIGITSISADSQGTSLIVTGWMCNSISCSSGNIGTIKIQNAIVSGTVAADKISRMVGTGSDIEVFGCDGGTSCVEQLLGKITIAAANITGSVRADAGVTSIVGNNSTLSITGMTCSDTVCSPISAGTLSVTGTNAVCPAGLQYQCVEVSGVKKCSPLSCNDDTYGGTVSPGQQICVKDFNSDGTIDFSSEMGICQQHNNKYYCPMQAQDCSTTENTATPTCPSGGILNLTTKRCEASPTSQYNCPSGYTLASGNVCAATPACPSGGTLNLSTIRCEASSTSQCNCPAGYTLGPDNICTGPSVSINPNQSSSYWFSNGAYRLYCSGSGMYLMANPGGNNRSWSITGATCSGDINGGANSACITYLAGSGNQLFVYAVPKTPEYCDDWGCYGGCGGTPMYIGALTFTGATVNGSVSTQSCVLDDAWDSGLMFHDRCVWTRWTGISVSAATVGCVTTTSCPAGYTLASGNICAVTPACPSGGTLNLTTKRCEAGSTSQNNCPSGYTLGSDNICTAAAVCTQGTLNNETLQCITGTTTSCPFGAQYECFPNAEKNNAIQCNNIPCIDGSTQGSTPKSSDSSSYHDDGPKDNTGKCLGTIMIFNGKPLECRPSGVNTNFFNCCDQSEGSFLFIKKMCGDPDTECVAKASTGSCHFIGDYCKQEWPLIGCVQHANVFCCFNSMMARIIHEQGRSQLQSFNGWGSVEAPDCRGFTIEEFSHLDFSKIDLSEYVNATKTKMENKIQIVKDKTTQQGVNRIQEITK